VRHGTEDKGSISTGGWLPLRREELAGVGKVKMENDSSGFKGHGNFFKLLS
jgi:hypothetical protein